MKRQRIYIGIVVLSLGIYILVQWLQPQPVDWTESYAADDTIPYGTYITRQLLPDLFPGQPITVGSRPLFGRTSADTADYSNAIFINSRFAPDKFEAGKLLDAAAAGLHIFIAARSIEGPLADSLQLKTASAPIISPNQLIAADDSVHFTFTGVSYNRPGGWKFPSPLRYYYFSDFDSSDAGVLGRTEGGRVNYIRMRRGAGSFYLHTVPFVYTNYYMRHPRTAEYGFRALSHLPVRPTLWDKYYKAGRATSRSPMRYIVSQPSLRLAWITTIAGLLLFIFFRSRRRQRIIPTLPPPENSTVEFARTIGHLYHQSGNHKNLATKKITYLMEYIRQEFHLETATVDDAFTRKVARRAGIHAGQVQSLFTVIRRVQDQPTLDSRELWELNRQIETFYQQSSR